MPASVYVAGSCDLDVGKQILRFPKSPKEKEKNFKKRKRILHA
jgi:hypothetical protein